MTGRAGNYSAGQAGRYVIFETKWGFFGLYGTENALLRSCLPLPSLYVARGKLLTDTGRCREDKRFCRRLQEQIRLYFRGGYVKFAPDVPVNFSSFRSFAQKVLEACRGIRLGETVAYGQLAEKAGFPCAGRAIGNVMAVNPLPLIIPCHRVIKADGTVGGFSASGGSALKRRLIAHEQAILQRQVRFPCC
ncbi:MAG: methylated-DNA--[protein]-cysteine S-methyltransferase [Planctomycetota bacterium]